MKQLYLILFIVTLQLSQFAQTPDSLWFNKGSIIWGAGIGQKTHLGNIGLTVNYFVAQNFSIKTSLGFGMLNYNGALLSAGPEYAVKLNKKLFCHLGTVYLVASSTSGSIETHKNDVPGYVIHSGAQYARPYLGLGIRLKEGFLKFEFGYSYIIHKPSYSTSGQWEPEYDKWIDEGLGSGISWGVIYQRGKLTN